MEPERIAYFRKRLETLAKEVDQALNASKDSANVVELDTAIGRLSRMDAMQHQQMAKGQQRRAKHRLERVDAVIEGFEDPDFDFGCCQFCGEPIALKRLEAQPDAISCVSCAAARERR